MKMACSSDSFNARAVGTTSSSHFRRIFRDWSLSTWYPMSNPMEHPGSSPAMTFSGGWLQSTVALPPVATKPIKHIHSRFLYTLTDHLRCIAKRRRTKAKDIHDIQCD